MNFMKFWMGDPPLQRIEAPRPLPPMLMADALERRVIKSIADEYGQRPRPPRTIASMVEQLENTDNQFEEACRLVDDLAALHRKLRAEILARLEIEDASLEARKIENERLRGRLVEPAAPVTPVGEEKQQAEAALGVDVEGGDDEAQ